MDEKKLTGSQLLDRMIALTFTRHCDLSEEEFLKVLEKEGNEDEEVRKSIFAIISLITKEMLVIKDKINLITATLNLAKEKENGRVEN